MPLLGDKGKLKVVLETASKISGEEVWVEISQIVLAEDIDSMEMEGDAAQKTQRTYEFLAKAVVNWNLQLADGTKAPITAENLRKLPMDDLMDLNNKFEYDRQLSRVKKNNSSSILQTENQESTPPSTTSS